MPAYAGPTSTDLAPDRGQVLRQLEFWFGQHLAGEIDIGWFDPANGQLNRFHRFDVGDIDECADFVIETNRVPGQSIYLRPALVDPTSGRFVRDSDFLTAGGPWCDLDDAGAAETAPKIYTLCRPNMVVVTGRSPHKRAQLFWRLEDGIDDPALLRDLNQRIATRLDGDVKVANPTTLMRVAGTIAWPWKAGRVPERTELMLFGDGRPHDYPTGALERAFPSGQSNIASSPPSDHQDGDRPATNQVHSLNIGSEFDGVTVEACLAAIRAGDHWHNNMVRLTGHWIARGWSDAEILTAAEAMTLPKYTIEQTRRDVARMIEGGRAKWSVPNPTHEMGTEQRPPFRLLDWTADRYAGEAKPIQWLCEGTIPLGAPVLFAAMGGLGKSYLALDLALQIAVGVCGLDQPKTILGGKVMLQGTAVVISAEDSFDAVHRRLNRIDPGERRLNNPHRMIVVPLADAGGPQPLIGADGGVPAKAPFFETLKAQLLEIADLCLVVIDPLQAFVMADVNSDPAAGQYMWTAFSELCATTGATVIVTHHMRKDGMTRVDSADDAREAIRGSTALVDGARLSYALWKAHEDTAGALCIQLDIEYENGRIVNGAVVKANEDANYAVHTYVREESGLLTDHGDLSVGAATVPSGPSMDEARRILEEIQRRFEAGTPFSHAPNSGARYLVHFLMRQKGMNRMEARNLLTDWLNNGVVEVDICDRKTKLTGLKVATWL